MVYRLLSKKTYEMHMFHQASLKVSRRCCVVVDADALLSDIGLDVALFLAVEWRSQDGRNRGRCLKLVVVTAPGMLLLLRPSGVLVVVREQVI